eukprot:COSAG02_NODE_5606_length_4192_cov_4.811630_2_plen_123_part_00
MRGEIRLCCADVATIEGYRYARCLPVSSCAPLSLFPAKWGPRQKNTIQGHAAAAPVAAREEILKFITCSNVFAVHARPRAAHAHASHAREHAAPRIRVVAAARAVAAHTSIGPNRSSNTVDI